ncbi:hypothetical protein F2Q69_00047440 [Brassica cretica]|uniref:Uncharacterized protein n=1 Tax=Brassica cretica TaxID=69181 RepID=A0A8S9PNQ3_BRACR|nr:hypothetical protein F2Q69_00047440 [Brassica cretica]
MLTMAAPRVLSDKKAILRSDKCDGACNLGDLCNPLCRTRKTTTLLVIGPVSLKY